MQSSMLSTQEFIKRKCSRDHFNSPVNGHPKHSSVYSIDYKSRRKMKLVDSNVDLGKQRNNPSKKQNEYLFPPTSVYRNSYEGSQVPVPVKHHEKPSYFLKGDSYEPLQSSYNRSSVLRASLWNQKELHGKPLMDNLFVPKYNKMNTKSLYRDSYNEYTKLPSVHKQKPQGQHSEFKALHLR